MKIKVTYINHSGFLVECEDCYLLFDYYKGVIPDLDDNKKLLVFVSHSHYDHFNPEIFELYKKHTNTSYFIASDIKLDDKNKSKFGITEEITKCITVARPNEEYVVSGEENMMISTLKSTDSGVAFLINYKGKTFYHAGDLNLWLWKGEDKQYNNNMKAIFMKEICKLDNMHINVAFAPLDPRQEEFYGLGMDELLDHAKVDYVFPMHFWEQPDTIKKYKKEREVKDISATIMDVKDPGQYWNLEI